MLGTILFGIIAIIVFIVAYYDFSWEDRKKYRKSSLSQKECVFYSVLATTPVVFIWLITVALPVVDGTKFINPGQRYEEIRTKISWVETGKVNGSMSDYFKLYEDITEYNSCVRFGKKNHGNVWNGIFVNDAFLTAEEIQMPDWLKK